MDQPILSNLGSGLIKQARTILGDEDILNWPTASGPVDCVPSPGTGKIVLPINAIFHASDSIPDFPYAGMLSGDVISLSWFNDDFGFTQAVEGISDPDATVVNFLSFGPYNFHAIARYNYLLRTGEIANSPLVARYVSSGAADPLTMGGASNTILITCSYLIYDLNLGQFVI